MRGDPLFFYLKFYPIKICKVYFQYRVLFGKLNKICFHSKGLYLFFNLWRMFTFQDEDDCLHYLVPVHIHYTVNMLETRNIACIKLQHHELYINLPVKICKLMQFKKCFLFRCFGVSVCPSFCLSVKNCESHSFHHLFTINNANKLPYGKFLLPFKSHLQGKKLQQLLIVKSKKSVQKSNIFFFCEGCTHMPFKNK